MSTPKRESVPPPRPPAPKGMTKRSSSSNSIKKSFKLLEEDEEDEENLTVLTGEFDKKLDKIKSESILLKADPPRETTPVKSSNFSSQGEVKSMALNPRSKSFDDDKSAINVSRIKQNFVDISSGLKDKIAKKWEEMNSNEADELEKSEVDPTYLTKLQQDVKNTDLKVKNVDNKVSFNNESKTVTDKTSAAENSQETTPVKKKVPPPSKLPPTPEDLENAAIAIIEEYYSIEPKEDFTGMPSLPQSNSYGEFPRQRSGLRKLISGKNAKPATAPASPVSMSKLMTKKEDMEEAAGVEEENKSSVSPDQSMGTNKSINNTTGSKKVTGVLVKTAKDTVILPVKRLTAGILIIFLYLILPLPSYISGMLMGIFIASLGWGAYVWITKPVPRKPTPERVPVSKLPPMVLPEMKDVVTEDGVFKVCILFCFFFTLCFD